MKHYAKLVLFSTLFIITANTTLQAGFLSSFKQTVFPLINVDNAGKRIVETLKNKWHYAAAGLVLLPSLAWYLKKQWAHRKNMPQENAFSGSTTSTTNSSPNETGSPILTALNSTDSITRNLPSSTPTHSPIARSPISTRGSVESSASPIASPQLQDDRNQLSNSSNEQQEQQLNDEYIEIKQIEQPSSCALEQSQNLEGSGFLSDSWVQIPAQPQIGSSLYKKIMQGHYFKPHSKYEQLENIVQVIHHFFDCAKKKDQGFTEGTLIIEDPEEKIYKTFFAYVKKCYPYAMDQEVMFSTHEAYPRRSSHFNEFYFYIFPEQKPTHFGIDTTENAHLPIEQMHHVLFGKKDDEHMFIRMETHGLQGRDVIGHIVGYIGSLGRKLCPLIFGSDVGEQLRKERVPTQELTTFNDLIQKIDQKKAEEYKNRAKGLGLQFMYQTIKGYINQPASSNNNNASDAAMWLEPAQNFVHQLERKYDYLDNRIGNEVILKIGKEL